VLIIAGTYHPGSLGRNALTGPNFLNVDYSIIHHQGQQDHRGFNLQF